jgi:hypothetical protein
MAMKIVILEDNAERQVAMRACLEDRFYTFEHRFFAEAKAMIGYLEDYLQETITISLDHDLDSSLDSEGRSVDSGTGRDVADFLAGQLPVCPVVIHTSNTVSALGMEKALRDAHWTTHRVVPFDDLAWIQLDWSPTMRRVIVGSATTHRYRS